MTRGKNRSGRSTAIKHHWKLAEVTLTGGSFHESIIAYPHIESVFATDDTIADHNDDISAKNVEVDAQAMSD